MEYMHAHSLNLIEAIYFSLGNKEGKTKHPLMKHVEENTQEAYDYIQSLNIWSTFEMNPGNHFKDADKRTARSILWLLDIDDVNKE